MNPFDLRGPEFLGFYLALGGLVFAFLWVRDRVGRRAPRGSALLRDPYLIAGLRGGEAEMTRVAVLAGLARGALIEAPDRKVMRAPGLPPGTAALGASPYAAPMEAAVLQAIGAERRTLTRLHRHEALRSATRAPLVALRELGLLPPAAEAAARWRLALGAGVVLLGVAAVKMVVALQRGHTNVGFLFLLAFLFAWGLTAWARARPRTQEGLRVLRDLRSLFGTRGARVPQGPIEGSANELLLTAAVGGIMGGPFFVPPNARQSSSSGSGCGTTVGCSSGCGGGCGGGGCGGCGS